MNRPLSLSRPGIISALSASASIRHGIGCCRRHFGMRAESRLAARRRHRSRRPGHRRIAAVTRRRLASPPQQPTTACCSQRLPRSGTISALHERFRRRPHRRRARHQHFGRSRRRIGHYCPRARRSPPGALRLRADGNRRSGGVPRALSWSRRPTYTVSTACTSGGKALVSARLLIDSGFCDAVITGGVDSLCRLTIGGFTALESTSPEVCQPLSRNRRGINIEKARRFS